MSSWAPERSWKSANPRVFRICAFKTGKGSEITLFKPSLCAINLAQDLLLSFSRYFLHWEMFPLESAQRCGWGKHLFGQQAEPAPLDCVYWSPISGPPPPLRQQMRGSGSPRGDSPTNNYPVSDFTLVQKPSAFTFCYRGQCWISLGFHDKFLCV